MTEKPPLLDLRIEELKRTLWKELGKPKDEPPLEFIEKTIDTWYAKTKKELKGKEITLIKGKPQYYTNNTKLSWSNPKKLEPIKKTIKVIETQGVIE